MARGGAGWKKLLGLGRKGAPVGASASKPDSSASDWQRAAKIFEEDGRFRDAARLYQGHGQNYDAARLLVQSGALTEAASIFERIGHFLKAAEVCAQSGDNRRAGENYRRYLEDRFGSLVTTRSPADHAEFTKYCRLAGQAFERAGLHEQAAEVLERGEQWEEAAALYLKLNRHVKAADLYQRAGAVDQAADVYAQAGDRVRAAQMRGEWLYKNDQKNEAAVQFLLGGDPLRAAEVYEEAGNYLDAARCYEHCGAHRQAAEAYERVKQFDRGAEMFARCQEYQKAAALYEMIDDLEQATRMYAEAGAFYRAAHVARDAGLSDLAIDYLQKVSPADPHYREALVELAECFIERDLPGVAVEKLKKALAKMALSADNVSVFYTLAVASEQMGDLASAADILKKVIAESYGYRDCVARLQDIERKLAQDVYVPPRKVLQTAGALDIGSRYEFIEKLGAGGMGVVYRARDTRLNRIVAYKMLMEQFMEVQDVRNRFLREAQSAAQLNHPNIVTVYDMDVDRDRNCLFIAMEFVAGESYFDMLQRELRLDVPTVLHFVVGVLKALAHAHGEGVVHRDIKPSNVMLSSNRVVKIMDFGLAKVLRQAKVLGSERASGTPLYMSPEQILGKAIDYRTDLYAFGGTVYHLLSGEPPFVDGEVLYHHVHSTPQPLTKLRPEIPRGLDQIVMSCLNKDPADRPSSEEILTILRKLS
ncbi:MAG TPA: protein kinase [Vicinamibacteria bacterium]|nr:protein kinase [Vicinamibacteria bacterium]